MREDRNREGKPQRRQSKLSMKDEVKSRGIGQKTKQKQ